MCSVTFHVIAITCVVWSLYVLIDRTAEEIKQGQLPLPALSPLPTLPYLTNMPLFCSILRKKKLLDHFVPIEVFLLLKGKLTT